MTFDEVTDAILEQLVEEPGGHWAWQGTMAGRQCVFYSTDVFVMVARHLFTALRQEPGKLRVVRTCGHPRCVNPDHRRLATGGGPSSIEHYTSIEVAEIRRLYADGMSPPQIAKQLGRSSQGVYDHLVAAKLYRSKQPKRQEVPDDRG